MICPHLFCLHLKKGVFLDVVQEGLYTFRDGVLTILYYIYMRKQIIALAFLPLLIAYGCTGNKTDESGTQLEGMPLKFSEQVFMDSCENPAASDSGVLRVNYKIAYVMADEANAEIANAINAEIVKYEFGEDCEGLPLEEAMKKTSEVVKADYLLLWQGDEPMYDDDEERTTNYEYEKSSTFAHGKGKILCYESSDYIYTAGAHGIYGTWVLNFDSSTGKLLKFEDVFQADKNAHVRQLIQQQLIEDFNANMGLELATAQDLKENGFMFEENLLPSTDIFRLGEEALTFIYGVYAIAPYALGETHVTIPYDKIEYCIKPEVKELLELTAAQ